MNTYPIYISKNATEIMKNQSFFNNSKWARTELSCSKKLSALLREITSNSVVIIIV